MTIGEAARAAGRSPGNFRTYDAQDVDTLRFIGRTRAAELHAKCAALMEVAAALQSLAEQCYSNGRPACPILDAAGLERRGHNPYIWDDDP